MPVIAISSFLSLPKSHDHRFEFRRVGRLIQTFLCSFLGKLCIKVPSVPNTEKNDAAAILDAVLLLLFHYLPLLETQTEPSLLVLTVKCQRRGQTRLSSVFHKSAMKNEES